MRDSKDEIIKEKVPKKKLKLLPKSNKLKALFFVELLVAMAFMVMMLLVDALPKKAALIIMIVLVALIVASLLLLRNRGKLPTKRRMGTVLACVTILIFGAGTYYLGTAFSMLNRISSSKIANSGADITNEPTNIYITGNDLWGDNEDDYKRSDMNMIVTINPTTRKILMTSIPRDSYVALHKNGQMDKLTHTGMYGVDETLNTVTDWLGYDFDYYLSVNFSAVVSVIDAMGGITVESPKDFESAIADYSYVKGENTLTGMEALYFARERKAFTEEGDEQRVKNQQAVMTAMINKLTSSKTLLANYSDLLDAMGDNLETNLSTQDMSALVKMQLEDMAGWEITQQEITGSGAMRTVASLSSANEYSVQIPDSSSVAAAIDGIDKVMHPTDAEIKEAEAAAEARREAAREKQKQAFFNKIFGIFK